MLEPLKMPESGRLRIGTCSWKYDSWKGLVYHDRKYKPHDYLADYAQYFNTVEIDQWFWSLFPKGIALPDPRTVDRYVSSVPGDFRFSIKVPNAITLTHFYAKQPKGAEGHANKPNPHFLDGGLFAQFLESLAPMREKLGPLMFQFEYLNKQKMASREQFLDLLGAFFSKAPQGYRYAVEVRNKNYLHEDFFRFLREHHVGCVLLDGYYMPPIAEVAQALEVAAGDVTVLRLHGPDRSGMEARTRGVWHQIVEPRDSALLAAAEIAQRCMDANSDVYVNVNNHYEGCAPLTIHRFLSKLEAR